MHQLTPLISNPLFNSGLSILTVGICFFLLAVLAMTILFGWSMRESAKGVAVLAIISLSAPAIAGQLNHQIQYKTKAFSGLDIQAIETVSLGQNKFLLTFNTSQPATCSLEYQDSQQDTVVPVLPTHNLESRTDHSFVIDNVSQSGGHVTLIINGDKYLFDKEPLIIKP